MLSSFVNKVSSQLTNTIICLTSLFLWPRSAAARLSPTKGLRRTMRRRAVALRVFAARPHKERPCTRTTETTEAPHKLALEMLVINANYLIRRSEPIWRRIKTTDAQELTRINNFYRPKTWSEIANSTSLTRRTTFKVSSSS